MTHTAGSPVTQARYAGSNDRRTGGRHLRRGPAVLATAVALAGACGSGGDSSAERASTGATTSTAAVTAAPARAAPAPATPTTSAGRGSTTTTTRPASTTTTTAVRAAPAPGLTFTPAGTYRYATTGRFTSTLGGTQARDGTATLTVDPPSGTDQRSVRMGFGRTTEQVLRLGAGAAYLVSLRLTDQGIDKEVRPSPPALALPGDAAPGRAWAWQAASTDGLTTVSSSFKVVRTEDVTVGPERVPAIVVEAVLTLAGDVVSTSRQTLWVSTRHRLVLRQDETTDGRIGLITFSGTASDSLVSLTPG